MTRIRANCTRYKAHSTLFYSSQLCSVQFYMQYSSIVSYDILLICPVCPPPYPCFLLHEHTSSLPLPLSQVWHVVVQSRQRVDIHASLGSSSSVDLVVRGDRYARRAHAYSSHCGDRLSFKPKTTFQLVPGAFNRVSVQFSPNLAGSRCVWTAYPSSFTPHPSPLILHRSRIFCFFM